MHEFFKYNVQLFNIRHYFLKFFYYKSIVICFPDPYVLFLGKGIWQTTTPDGLWTVRRER